MLDVRREQSAGAPGHRLQLWQGWIGHRDFKVKDGRVIGQWAELDIFGLLQQIGAIPAA